MDTCKQLESESRGNERELLTYSHDDAANAYIWAKSFAYPRAFPKDARDTIRRLDVYPSSYPDGVIAVYPLPILVSVENAWREVVNICARADEEQDDEEEGLEVEERRLRGVLDVIRRRDA